MSDPLESQIESSLTAYAKKHGIYTRKFTSPSSRGVPDRVFAFQGVVLFVEIKRKGAHPTKLQLYEIGQLHDVGVPATWVDNVASGRQLLEFTFPKAFKKPCGCGCSDML